LAKRLPKYEQAKALWYGLAGAFVFRFLAVILASLLLRWTFAKFLGGAYLVYIAVRHLFFESKEDDEKDKIVLDEHGHPKLVDEDTGSELSAEQQELEVRERVPVYLTPERRKQLGLASFWPTVFIIELTDIAFAVDSILAAIAMVGSPPKGHPAGAFHPKLWVIVLGGLIGLMLMRVAARMFIQLLEKFPRFEVSAYLLVIVIGLKLLADWGLNSDWSFTPAKPIAGQVDNAGWKEPFRNFEKQRIEWVHSYEKWLKNHWVFGLAEHHEAPAQAGDIEVPHTPHLLDFHSPRRPEFIAFWTLMLGCFLLGFLPKRQRDGPPAAK
jgi:YkoY family integral membrane protein